MRAEGREAVILYAEDDEEDRLLIADAVEESRLCTELHFVGNGDELLDYLTRRGDYTALAETPLPGLVLLDLNMPRKDGREALRDIRADPRLRHLPIVVLTTSCAEEDIAQCYDLGANSFIRKPASFESLVDIVETLGEYWLQVVHLPQHPSS